MTSAAQPNPIEDLTAQAELRSDALAEQAEPEYVGDLPDDPEEAIHYRPGTDGAEGAGTDR
jgi:hypothetical protein